MPFFVHGCKCPLCDSPEAIHSGHTGSGSDDVTCPNCGLVYFHPNDDGYHAYGENVIDHRPKKDQDQHPCDCNWPREYHPAHEVNKRGW
jgi:hypothetical protein